MESDGPSLAALVRADQGSSHCRMHGPSILTLLFLLSAIPTSVASPQCELSATETLEIGQSKGNLLQIHIRNNIQVSRASHQFFISCTIFATSNFQCSSQIPPYHRYDLEFSMFILPTSVKRELECTWTFPTPA